MDERHLTRDNAVRMLDYWRSVMDERDSLVRAAYSAGVTKADIYRHTGIARTTINKILSGRPDG